MENESAMEKEKRITLQAIKEIDHEIACQETKFNKYKGMLKRKSYDYLMGLKTNRSMDIQIRRMHIETEEDYQKELTEINADPIKSKEIDITVSRSIPAAIEKLNRKYKDIRQNARSRIIRDFLLTAPKDFEKEI